MKRGWKMTIVFKAKDGTIFERKETCLNYELKIKENIIIEKQNKYYRYRNYHRHIFNKYLKIKNKTFKDVVSVSGENKSNKYKRKLYWQTRNNTKKELIESEKKLMELKMAFFAEVKKYKKMRKECLNGVKNDR